MRERRERERETKTNIYSVNNNTYIVWFGDCRHSRKINFSSFDCRLIIIVDNLWFFCLKCTFYPLHTHPHLMAARPADSTAPTIHHRTTANEREKRKVSLTIRKESSFHIIQQIIVAKQQTDALGIARWCTSRISRLRDVFDRFRINARFLVVMIFYLKSKVECRSHYKMKRRAKRRKQNPCENRRRCDDRAHGKIKDKKRLTLSENVSIKLMSIVSFNPIGINGIMASWLRIVENAKS